MWTYGFELVNNCFGLIFLQGIDYFIISKIFDYYLLLGVDIIGTGTIEGYLFFWGLDCCFCDSDLGGSDFGETEEGICLID